jgi:hypothetical protein
MVLVKKSFLKSIRLILVAGIVFSAGCSKPVEVQSRWPDHEIIIDGNDDEWGSATIYSTEAKVSLTLINDNEKLYLRLYSRDRDVQMQILSGGLTIWFDPDHDKKKIFGIHFPMRREHMDMGMPMGEIKEPEDMEYMINESFDELELLYPEIEESHRFLLPAARIHGIEAKLSFSKGNLVYELKVPLVQSEEHKYAVRTNEQSDSVIHIGFETAEIDREAMKEKMQEHMERDGGQMPEQGSGMPPAGGNMPMPPGGGPPGMGKMAEPLDLWIAVKLASAPQSQD